MGQPWIELDPDEQARKFAERIARPMPALPAVTADAIARWCKSAQAERMARRIADAHRWLRGSR